jgi:hypothetical protein
MTQAQDEFVKQFEAYLISSKAYPSLANFLKHSRESDLEDCATVFFRVVENEHYDVRDERVRKTFFDLCSQLLTRANVYFALRFELLIVRMGTPWQTHFDAQNPATRARLIGLLHRKKTYLSPASRGFIHWFDRIMKSPREKVGADFQRFMESYLKYPASLQEMLLVYIEISRAYLDDNPKSMMFFFILSFYVLPRCDLYFAQQYEIGIKTEGQIWKRRFDALKDDQKIKIKQILLEKQTVVRQKINYKKKTEVGVGNILIENKTLSLRDRIPNTVPAPKPEPEDWRPAQPQVPAQHQFAIMFTRFMNSENKKAEQIFSDYLFARSARELQDILETYLEFSKKYPSNDRKSLYAFFGTASLAVERSGAYYAFKFRQRLNSPRSLVAQRFAALQSYQQKELKDDIARMEKRRRIIDDLKFAYYQQNHIDADIRALRNFEITISDEQSVALSLILDRCDRAYYESRNLDDLYTAFDELAKMLHAENDVTVLYGLAQHCKKGIRNISQVRRQVYWYMVGVLYIKMLPQRPEVYKRGLNQEELDLFFDAADRSDPYFYDFGLRMDYLWMLYEGPDQWLKIAKASAGLLVEAARMNMRYVPLEEAAEVFGLVEVLKKKKPDFLYGIKIPVTLPNGSGATLRVGQSLGNSIHSNTYILWRDPNYGGDVYLQIRGYEGLLFSADLATLGRRYFGALVYQAVAEATADIMVVLNLYFQFLTYLPDLMTGGLSGVVQAAIINYVIGKSVDALGIDSNAFQLVMLGAGILGHFGGEELHAGEIPNEGTGNTGISHLDVPSGEMGLNPVPHEDLLLSGNVPSGGGGHSGVGLPGGSSPGLPSRKGIDMRGVDEGDFIRVRGVDEGEGLPATNANVPDLPRRPNPSEAELAALDNRMTRSSLTESDGISNRTTSSPSTQTASPMPATHEELVRSETHLNEMKAVERKTNQSLTTAAMESEGYELQLEKAKSEPKKVELREKLKHAHEKEEIARARNAEAEYNLAEARERVNWLRNDLESRGLATRRLRDEWNPEFIRDKPVVFKKAHIKDQPVFSYNEEYFIGTRQSREDFEKVLQYEPHGPLSQKVLDPKSATNPEDWTFYKSDKAGDLDYWKENPQLVEIAHVMSKKEGGREVCVLMTKARNRELASIHENTGGLILDRAIVIQNVAVDRESALAWGIDRAEVDSAPVIYFEKNSPVR